MKKKSDLEEVDSVFEDFHNLISSKQEKSIELLEIAGFKKLKGQSSGREIYRHGSGFDISRSEIKGINGCVVLESLEVEIMADAKSYNYDKLKIGTEEEMYETLGHLTEILGYDFSVCQLRIKERIREEKIKSLGL